jgi:hypothetical protein
MNPFEKLLLRRARNSDLQRSAQWLANITLAYATENGLSAHGSDELGQTMEYYGMYAETEDPEALINAEAELGRVVKSAPLFKSSNENDEVVG